jgi:hypothetical protein
LLLLPPARFFCHGDFAVGCPCHAARDLLRCAPVGQDQKGHLKGPISNLQQVVCSVKCFFAADRRNFHFPAARSRYLRLRTWYAWNDRLSRASAQAGPPCRGVFDGGRAGSRRAVAPNWLQTQRTRQFGRVLRFTEEDNDVVLISVRKSGEACRGRRCML